jgi:hypothetical protein
MQFSSTNLNECEICHRPRRKGNHDACSKKKQAMAEAAKPKRKQSTRTYNNERLLTGFLKTIE